MALSTNQQIFELVNKNKSILIIFKKDWTGDALASSLALANVLKKYDKKIDIVCQNFKTPQSLSYLPTDQIIGGLSNLQKFVISVDTTKTQVGEFFYDTDEKKLNIYLTPKEGQFGHEDITTAISDFKYDGRKLLCGFRTYDKNDNRILQRTYTYDKVGNIKVELERQSQPVRDYSILCDPSAAPAQNDIYIYDYDNIYKIQHTNLQYPQGQNDHEDITYDYDNLGNIMSDGTYSFMTNAVDISGTDIAVTPLIRGSVTGVSFDNGNTLISVGGQSVSMSSIIEVNNLN